MIQAEERIYRKTQWLPAPVDRVFSFFSDAKNLERITPPWLNFRIVYQSDPEIGAGCIFKYKLRIHGIPVRWTTEIIQWDENKSFVDFQKSGPYSLWHHSHLFRPKNDGTEMEDLVRYRIPFGILGDLIAGAFVERDVSEIFEYRAQIIEGIFSNHHQDEKKTS